MRKWIAWLLLLISMLQCFAFAETDTLQINAPQIASANSRTAVRTSAEVYFVLPADGGEILVRMPLDGSAPALIDSADDFEDLVAFNNGVAYIKTANGMTTIENCLGSSISTVYSFGAGTAEYLSVYGNKLLVLMGGLLHSIEPDTSLCLKLSGATMLDYVIGNGYAYFVAGGDQIEYSAQLDAENTVSTQAGCLYRLDLNSGETELMLKSGVVDLDIQNQALYFHNLADAYAVRTADETTLCGRVYSLDAQMMTLENECKEPDSGFWPLSAGLVAWYDGALNMDTEAGVLALYTPEAGAQIFSDGDNLYIWEPVKQTLTEARTNGTVTVLFTGDLAKVVPAPTATPAPTASPEATMAAVDLDDTVSSDWFNEFMNNASNATGNDYTAPSGSTGSKATPIPQATPTPSPTFPGIGSGSSSSNNSSSSGSSSSGSSSSSSSSSSASGKTVKATGDVYIRSKPNTGSSKLGSIKTGKVATYLGSTSTDSRGVKWYKVKYNGVTGWVSSKYSKLGNYSSSSSSSGSSSSVSGNTVKATGDLYIRSKANKSSSALGSMKKGAVATFLGSTSTDSRGVKWYKVKYDGVTGWVSSKYSKVGYYSSGSSDSSSTSGDTVKTTGDVFIRSKPNKESSKLGSMKKGKTATYLGESSVDSRGVRWYKVKYNGVTGWVSSKYSKLQ